ncbi:unnamed protein product [Rotaria sp. Silwood1]|nr:unnamed protein product [Rotaria sp. Silwood1]
MNRTLMVIRYRKATHIGLSSSFTRTFVQICYEYSKLLLIINFVGLDNLDNVWIFIEEDKSNAKQQIKQSIGQFCSVRPPREYRNQDSSNNNICSSKQTSDETDLTKYQTINRSISLPARQTFSSSKNNEENIKQRRRYASSSNNNNKTISTSLVTSFLQYLRGELRATTNENNNDYRRIQKKKSSEDNNYLCQTLYLSNNLSRQQYSIQMLSSSSSSSSALSSQALIISPRNLSNENLLKNTYDNNPTNDDHEILTIINLLILRVECLTNDNTLVIEKKNKKISPKIKKINQNLIEYLYYLFNKFINEDTDSNTLTINKKNFVNVSQIVVCNGSLNMPTSTSLNQSLSEFTITNDSDHTLIQTYVHEYRTDTNDMTEKCSSINEQTSSVAINDRETWLVVDLGETKRELLTTKREESKCLLSSSSTCDDQLLPTNENYFSIEEIKSCESESSQSNYYSPDSSLDDLDNMTHEIDEINNNNNNHILFNEEGSFSPSSSSSSSNEHVSNNTNVIIIEGKDTTSNNNICTGLTNDCNTNSSNSNSNEQVASSTMDTTEPMTTNLNHKMSRRERKMQERWTITTKNNKNTTEQLPTKTFLGVEFPPIAVLRRKFSSSPPSQLSPTLVKKKDYSTVKTKVLTTNDEINKSLQGNIDKTNEHISSIPLNHSTSLQNQEINTSIATSIVNQTKHDHQMLDLKSNDTSSLLIFNDSKPNDDIQQSPIIISNLLTDEKILNENMKIKTKPDLIENEKEIITNINHDLEQHEQSNINTNNNSNNNSITIMDSIHINSPSSSSSLLLISSSSSSLPTNTNEEKTIELLPKEIEEEKKEEYFDDDDDNVHVAVVVEKKNNFNVEHNYHPTSGTILINDEPTQAVLLEQEKKEKNEEEKEKEQPLLPTLEQCNHQHFQDESSLKILSNNNLEINKIMSNIDNNHEELYKTVEIEEIPDDDDDDLLKQTNSSIEPTDFIFTDEEIKIPRQTLTTIKTNKTTKNDIAFEYDPVLSCYEKAFSKIVENIDDSIKPSNIISKESQIPLTTTITTTTTAISHQRPEDDPIALRALKRFEQSMNAAMATKIGNDETNSVMVKGKSSWSGTLSNQRKSLENVFKNDQTTPLTSTSTNEQSTISPRDTFIRPRKTILDDIGINFGLTRNLSSTVQNNSTNNDNHKIEEQQSSIAIVENNETQVVPDESTTVIDSEGQQEQEQEMIINSLMSNEKGSSNEAENSNLLTTSSIDSSLNTVISHTSSEQQTLTPYRLQLEGRRRLNTLERIRDRHDSNDLTQQLSHQYTVKPEELQDPIIRRALERFDEKSRSLVQTKPINYDDIQDPITRRALMRLETNLKRTIPSNPTTTTLTSTNNDSNETWFTNSYTLGSLQTNNDNRLPTRYPDSSVPFNKTPHVSIHQRFCSASSSDMSELSPNNMNLNNEHDIPIMRVPTQPIYVTSNNQQQQQQQQPITVRQRSHSEDMLSSRDISMNETINLDNNTNQLQRNHSSDELQHQQPQQQETSSSSNAITTNKTDLPLPATILKSLDSNFVRTTEASVNYVTPTQTYSAYSCEYTRPHQNSLLTSPKLELPSPRNYQQPNENDTQCPNPSSAFTPVHPSTNNYYPQQPLPIPSYTSMYTSNNLNQTPYSDDPIVRRALERFNSQLQHSLMNTPQYQPTMNGMSRPIPNGYPRQGNFDSYYPPDSHQYDPWANFNRTMPPAPNTSTGYQSIIGRRRQLRHDDNYHDVTSVGNAYSSLVFVNSQNPYPTENNLYMNFPNEQPPAIPPRLHRDVYREQQPEYISENINNNNNNNNNNAYIHQGYATIPNGFRPISHTYMPSDSFHQYQDDEYLRHRAQSTSSTTSSDSVHPIHLTKQRLPPTFTRTNIQQNKKLSADDSQSPSGQTTPNNGSVAGDSVFHRLAYTATKSSLSKSSSNLCANLLNKTPQHQQQQQQQQTKSNHLKPYEIDYDDSNNIPNKQESTSTNLTNKCQRSRSVDGRARLKNAQTRAINNNNNHHHHMNRSANDSDDNNSTTVPSSKFTSMNIRRDTAPPPRIPITPRSTLSDRAPLTKRVSSGNNLSYPKNQHGNRTRHSNGNLIDTDNDENLTFNDNYQPKIIDNKTRSSMSTHRYATNNNNNNNNNNNLIQSSASTSSVNSTMSRTKVPIPILANLDKKDSNTSSIDLHRSSKRSEDNRLISPTGQRRNIPVSVFSPAKHDTKRPVPSSSTSPTDDSASINNGDSQHEQEQQQTSYSSRSSTGDGSYTAMNNTNEMNNKLSTTNSALKTSTGNILDELSLTNEKHDNTKKMNVFERLFRGHKKKV